MHQHERPTDPTVEVMEPWRTDLGILGLLMALMLIIFLATIWVSGAT
jgi:hypothetical protein